jgi:hypothetical protein
VIIFNDTVALGDTLCTFPTVRSMLIQTDEPSSVYWTNSDAGALFPHARYNAVQRADPPSAAHDRVIRISLHDFVWSRPGWEHAPQEQFHSFALRRHGFTIDDDLRLELAFPIDSTVPTYDFVIAPCVLNNAWKNMGRDFWQALVTELRWRYGGSICAIGTSRLPSEADLLKIEPDIDRFRAIDYRRDNLTQYLVGVDYFWDEPLSRVAQLLSNVRGWFISVDSGPSHLMRGIRRPHIEIYRHSVAVRYRTGMKDIEIPVPCPTVADIIAIFEQPAAAGERVSVRGG